MTTATVVASLQEQLRGIQTHLDTTLEEWRSADEESRGSIQERIGGIESTIEEIRGQITEVQRFSLPGSEPNEASGQRFSMSKAAFGIAHNSWDGAGFEKEVLDTMRERAMSSGVDGAGGHIVPDEAIPQVIERLKARVVAMELGARELTATGSPILIPRISTSATAVWMTGENTSITASDLGFDQISMSPKSVAGRVILANQLMELSAPTADGIIEDDLVSQLSIGIDKAIIEGSGASGEPQGITEDGNVLTETLSATPTFAQLVGFIDALANANSLRGKLGWAMHPSVLTSIMTIPSDNNTAGTGNVEIARRVLSEGMLEKLLGYEYRTTTSFTATSGAKSAVFGNWEDVMIAMWGGLRLRASDVADSAYSNDQTHIRGIMRVDTALRHSESMCVAAA